MLRSSPSRFDFLSRSTNSYLITATPVVIGLSILMGSAQAPQADLRQLPQEHAFSVNISYEMNDVPNLRYDITPERRALLNTIRYAEGTWKDGKDLGYRTLFGGDVFDDLSKHPNRVVVNFYSSAAAGAYQFIPTTWMTVAKELNLPNFQPKHQDQAALHLVSKRGALKEIDSFGLTQTAMARLAPEWASFPNWSGKSSYGQPVKTRSELAKFYERNLLQLRKDALARKKYQPLA